MQHPNKSFHPTPLRVERDQAFLVSGSTRMFSRSRTVARVNGIALGAHPSRTVVQSETSR